VRRVEHQDGPVALTQGEGVPIRVNNRVDAIGRSIFTGLGAEKMLAARAVEVEDVVALLHERLGVVEGPTPSQKASYRDVRSPIGSRKLKGDAPRWHPIVDDMGRELAAVAVDACANNARITKRNACERPHCSLLLTLGM
jgi:hypothetical protein